MMLMMMMIMLDDDGVDDDDDDDDDDVERIRTAPYAVRSDVEFWVTVTIMLKYPIITTFSAHTKKAGQQARANRGVWPKNYQFFSAQLLADLANDWHNYSKILISLNPR